MRYAHARFDAHDRFFAALDAVLESLAVSGATEDIHAAAGNYVLFGLFLGVGALAVSQSHGELALVAMVDGAVSRLNLGGRLAGLGPDQRPVGILELISDGHLVGGVVHAVVRRLAAAIDAHRADAVRIHDPLRDAHDVRAAVADLAAAEIEQPAELAVCMFHVVGNVAGWTDPGVIVQLRRRSGI